MKLSNLLSQIGLSLPEGSPDREITGIATLTDASPSHLSFFHNSKYLSQLQKTRAGAVLLEEKYLPDLPKGVIPIVTSNPYLKIAEASQLFALPPWEEGEAEIAPTAQIGKGVVIGKGAKIGENVQIMPNVVIAPEVEIGEGSVIYPNVSIYRGTKIGKRVRIHSGAVIGSDGFGYAHTPEGEHIKIFHLGRVVIGDDTEIGANTTIDRGVFGETRIGKGVKIDNLVQIGHNCQIGDYAILVSQVGLSGSTKLGRNVIMGGQSATAGHLEIAPFTTIAARGGVTKSITKPGTYSGFPLMEHKKWLKLQTILSQLLKGRLKKGEK
ncbi:MAG: UDP-3-O-(3-hydroxymyristoyl)glucosamine N-acyltransferase [Epsilonproteobacteria bacterium]|nr:UDP-3-O-(3-hydroxymyristoyl)glucosamine N-acyltransferase [Campylobacterota bacterium]NPA89580.1 UDP-3-O-(3-hydroxymyristoyl)glucosamine N-acyltransferase [Campylobacterota bacterium]